MAADQPGSDSSTPTWRTNSSPVWNRAAAKQT